MGVLAHRIGPFWARVDKQGPNGCWLWTGSTTEYGYGRFDIGGTGRPGAAKRRQIQAHRFSYQ